MLAAKGVSERPGAAPQFQHGAERICGSKASRGGRGTDLDAWLCDLIPFSMRNSTCQVDSRGVSRSLHDDLKLGKGGLAFGPVDRCALLHGIDEFVGSASTFVILVVVNG